MRSGQALFGHRGQFKRAVSDGLTRTIPKCTNNEAMHVLHMTTAVAPLFGLIFRTAHSVGCEKSASAMTRQKCDVLGVSGLVCECFSGVVRHFYTAEQVGLAASKCVLLKVNPLFCSGGDAACHAVAQNKSWLA